MGAAIQAAATHDLKAVPSVFECKLPAAPRPRGLYVSVQLRGGLAYSAGMTPRRDGRLVVTGRVGAEVSIRRASEAAGLAACNALAAIAAAVGGLEQVLQLLQMTVYLQTTPEFEEHSAVADGASEALAQMLGSRALVARTAVGVLSLPGDAPVEIAVIAAYARKSRRRKDI